MADVPARLTNRPHDDFAPPASLCCSWWRWRRSCPSCNPVLSLWARTVSFSDQLGSVSVCGCRNEEIQFQTNYRLLMERTDYRLDKRSRQQHAGLWWELCLGASTQNNSGQLFCATMSRLAYQGGVTRERNCNLSRSNIALQVVPFVCAKLLSLLTVQRPTQHWYVACCTKMSLVRITALHYLLSFAVISHNALREIDVGSPPAEHAAAFNASRSLNGWAPGRMYMISRSWGLYLDLALHPRCTKSSSLRHGHVPSGDWSALF